MKINALDIIKDRDNRIKTQKFLVEKYNLPVISFTLNIPGEEKRGFLFDFLFQQACYKIENFLQDFNLLYKQINPFITGNVAFFVYDQSSMDLKRKCIEIEDSSEISRLYDIDVIDNDTLYPISRKLFGLNRRKCIVCGNDYYECRYNKSHSLEEVYDKVLKLSVDKVSESFANLAKLSLIYELDTTPKPGLIDRNNCGSHKDMDYALFEKSIEVITPYLKQEYKSALEIVNLETLFSNMKQIGIKAEEELMKVTGGINTHKGAFFSLSVIGCAICYLGMNSNITKIGIENFSKSFTEYFISNSKKLNTHGEQVRLSYNKGIFNESLKGYPCCFVDDNLFHEFEKDEYKKEFYKISDRFEFNSKFFIMNFEEILLKHLVRIMAKADDSNMIYRGGIDALNKMNSYFTTLKLTDNLNEILLEKDKEYISKNLSPGGCADLLSLSVFLSLTNSLLFFV